MLKTNKLSLKYNTKELFKDIDISLDSASNKKIALVGRNGCGKSTLLKVLLGEISPTSGTVDSANEKIGYLPQEIIFPDFELVGEFLEDKLEEAWMDYKVDIAMGDVGLGEEYLLKRLDKLSGGEKVKVALAGLLMDEPTILFMDEPTNNLDSVGVEWLERFILKFNGSMIVVSHDRLLINRAINEVWEIDPTDLGIKVYGGNYDDFLKERDRLYEKRLREFNSEKREYEKIKKWVHEHESHPKYRFSNIMARQKAKLKRMDREKKEKPVSDPKIKMQDLKAEKRGLVLKTEIEEKSFGKNIVLKNLEFDIHKGERILLHGANGAGKTTLLKIISGQDKDFKGNLVFGDDLSIGYLRQFSSLDDKKSVLEEFEEKTGILHPKSRSILAGYSFLSDQVMGKVGMLSYGQKKRLELAIILSCEPNLLILDEPTNHLDIYTREELEDFITEQEIPMIIVSHDRYFIKKLGIDKEIKLG